jgi:hypothetical protein
VPCTAVFPDPRRAAVRVRIGADGEVLREGTALSHGLFP